MPGIYIHIPFCLKKCAYCNFFSVTDISLKSSFMDALLKEMEMRSAYLKKAIPTTLYFGGGTPSLLSSDEIQGVIDKAKILFNLSPQAEITLEANPNNLTEDYLRRLKETAINRLSIGVQSFFDEDMLVLGRIHTAKQAEDSIALAIKYGYENLSVDLIYGFPLLTFTKWKENLEKIKDVPHLSCYQLTLESGTPLYKQLNKKKYQYLSEEEVIQQYDYLMAFAKKHHFTHYETSNFCKENNISKHNTAYWKNEFYVGFGPGAHSFDGQYRQWNKNDVNNYISFFNKIETKEQYDLLSENKLFEKEYLTLDMCYNEYIMISLRTMWGCNLKDIQSQFGEKYIAHLYQELQKINPTHYELKNDELILTEKGSLFADFIASSLFM